MLIHDMHHGYLVVASIHTGWDRMTEATGMNTLPLILKPLDVPCHGTI